MTETTCLFITNDELETKQLAKQMALFLQAGDVLALEGDLGAGKTTFAQGLAEGLEVSDKVDSPTFTIIKEYNGRIPFYHMDVYRLDPETDELGLEDYFYGQGICLVEWASQVETLLPEQTIWLRLTVQSDGKRQIQLKSNLIRVEQLCKELQSR
ncbi:tRNA (adenosine(37)-N6)-threonylcarbamoyltransferase complex ATPase subunit type 1 TsaE [Hazenella coriacea]|uniref:tRNA threonylcarbamoyladenosine biosynthesis protein TsaE n=1 Tax=Hazenella coriacea TaxID=1179467 RepID=A0A4R3L273_9BACL|nr:tRNA (adenosine(37)-N6)-threonylcarbamoyltransferase complex ATPase subunit type 1 TsaE [Hazenella coriacea]TCS93282.1 tRNA threonylcarbamoyladenosine biosynthesis protein TsaE [Hazenella coriacea]